MRSLPFLSPSLRRIALQRATAALGLFCVLAGGSAWAQQAKPELAPPPGTMMGAYGQSLMQQPAAPAHGTGGTGNAATAAANAQAGSLTGTAGHGQAGDAVTRFLQQRGILSQAQGESGTALLNQVKDKASDLVLSAMNFLGVPYRRGGSSLDNGFDCSGFTRHIFEMSVGLVLPRRADEQAKMSSLVSIKKEELKPGDLVFFNTMRRTFSHVGIYVGEGKFIHSPRAGGAVRVEDMREAYWSKRFTGARRADLNQAGLGSGS